MSSFKEVRIINLTQRTLYVFSPSTDCLEVPQDSPDTDFLEAETLTTFSAPVQSDGRIRLNFTNFQAYGSDRTKLTTSMPSKSTDEYPCRVVRFDTSLFGPSCVLSLEVDGVVNTPIIKLINVPMVHVEVENFADVDYVVAFNGHNVFANEQSRNALPNVSGQVAAALPKYLPVYMQATMLLPQPDHKTPIRIDEETGLPKVEFAFRSSTHQVESYERAGSGFRELILVVEPRPSGGADARSEFIIPRREFTFASVDASSGSASGIRLPVLIVKIVPSRKGLISSRPTTSGNVAPQPSTTSTTSTSSSLADQE